MCHYISMKRYFICYLIVCFVSLHAWGQIGGKTVYYDLLIPTKQQSYNQKKSDDYRVVDEYARNAPEFNHISQLADYLSKPYKNNERLRARAVFAWMVYHLSYDQFKADNMVGNNKHGRPKFLNSGDAFKTRVGVCGDFADLFVKIANRANLKAVRIDGVAGYHLTRQSALSSAHAWNGVRIDKKWYLLDVTWAMGGDFSVFEKMENIRDYKKTIRERQRTKTHQTVDPKRLLNNVWFLTAPDRMIETHFPNDIKWQLLDEPITPKDVFKANEGSQKTSHTYHAQPVKMIIPRPIK